MVADLPPPPPPSGLCCVSLILVIFRYTFVQLWALKFTFRPARGLLFRSIIAYFMDNKSVKPINVVIICTSTVTRYTDIIILL